MVVSPQTQTDDDTELMAAPQSRDHAVLREHYHDIASSSKCEVAIRLFFRLPLPSRSGSDHARANEMRCVMDLLSAHRIVVDSRKMWPSSRTHTCTRLGD